MRAELGNLRIERYLQDQGYSRKEILEMIHVRRPKETTAERAMRKGWSEGRKGGTRCPGDRAALVWDEQRGWRDLNDLKGCVDRFFSELGSDEHRRSVAEPSERHALLSNSPFH